MNKLQTRSLKGKRNEPKITTVIHLVTDIVRRHFPQDVNEVVKIEK